MTYTLCAIERDDAGRELSHVVEKILVGDTDPFNISPFNISPTHDGHYQVCEMADEALRSVPPYHHRELLGRPLFMTGGSSVMINFARFTCWNRVLDQLDEIARRADAIAGMCP